jgi:hypothetical protein
MQIEHIVRAAEGQTDELAAIRAGIAALPGVVMKNDTGWIENMSVTASPRGLQHEYDCLTKIQGLGLSIAPVVVGWFSTNASQVLVRRYDACPGEKLHRVATSDTFRVSATAEARFVSDLGRLADAGFMHAVCARAATHWLYSERTRIVVLDAWAALRPLEDRAEMMEAVLSDIRFVNSRADAVERG